MCMRSLRGSKLDLSCLVCRWECCFAAPKRGKRDRFFMLLDVTSGTNAGEKSGATVSFILSLTIRAEKDSFTSSTLLLFGLQLFNEVLIILLAQLTLSSVADLFDNEEHAAGWQRNDDDGGIVSTFSDSAHLLVVV